MRLDVLAGLVIGAAVAAAGCSGNAAQKPQPNAQAAAVPITATSAVRKTMPLDADVIGNVEAYSTVAVRAQITGELTAVHFKQGDDVESGQELFNLDKRPYEAALQQATA